MSLDLTVVEEGVDLDTEVVIVAMRDTAHIVAAVAGKLPVDLFSLILIYRQR